MGCSYSSLRRCTGVYRKSLCQSRTGSSEKGDLIPSDLPEDKIKWLLEAGAIQKATVPLKFYGHGELPVVPASEAAEAIPLVEAETEEESIDSTDEEEDIDMEEEIPEVDVMSESYPMKQKLHRKKQHQKQPKNQISRSRPEERNESKTS